MDAYVMNPIAANGADPWVVQHKNSYYYCQSAGDGIFVTKAETLQEIGLADKVAVWKAPQGKGYSKEIWAPELHNLDGRWYIYFAADDGNNDNHRMYVLESKGSDPMGPYSFKGRISAETDRWAIDGTVLDLGKDKRYFIWSGWEGSVNVAQNLYIAKMGNPWTIEGDRVMISKPTYPWELIGNPLINEGPEILKKGSKVHIIYSASGSWTDDYCLGRLTLSGVDPMDPKAWVKYPKAVFSRTEGVLGPGHASFVKSPSGAEDWIVYHAAKYSGAGWNRNVRIQKFTWDKDGNPMFGKPIDEYERMIAPK